MELKLTVVLFVAVWVSAIHGVPVSKTHGTTTATPSLEEETSPPWLKYLKNKKTTPTPSKEVVGVPSTSSKMFSGKMQNAARAISSYPVQPAPIVTDPIAQWFGIPVQSSGNFMAQDRADNPGSLYDAVYLDWMKRDLMDSDPQANPIALTQTADPPAPAPAGYAYPAYPTVPMYGFPSFIPSLASFKVQKAIAQAQVDAALAAVFNITTTPKPLKLKLKIQVPGNVNVTQLGQITAGLAGSLPPGSTFELD